MSSVVQSPVPNIILMLESRPSKIVLNRGKGHFNSIFYLFQAIHPVQFESSTADVLLYSYSSEMQVAGEGRLFSLI